MKRPRQDKECKNEIDSARNFRTKIPSIVNKLVSSCTKEGCFDHVSAEPIPHREAMIDILRRLALVLYPGYFVKMRLDQNNLEYYLGQQITSLYEMLSEQIILAIRHDCIRQNKPCVNCEDLGHKITVDFLSGLPDLRELLAKDIRAAYDGDPAAKGYDEVIFSYPGPWAITVYRIAHKLHDRVCSQPHRYRYPSGSRNWGELFHRSRNRCSHWRDSLNRQAGAHLSGSYTGSLVSFQRGLPEFEK